MRTQRFAPAVRNGDASRIERGAPRARGLDFDVDVRNLTGHKLPTGYPSRRAWLHVAVRDGGGRLVFESGAPTPTERSRATTTTTIPRGSSRTTPRSRRRPGADLRVGHGRLRGAVTTGLLRATQFVKDNRLLPRGFDKATARRRSPSTDGAAATRTSRTAAIACAMSSTPRRAGPYDVTVELWYQPIAFRWAKNLEGYDAPEPRRFVSYFDSMASGSSVVVAKATVKVDKVEEVEEVEK